MGEWFKEKEKKREEGAFAITRIERALKSKLEKRKKGKT